MTKIIKKFVVTATLFAMVLQGSNASAQLVNHNALTVPVSSDVDKYSFMKKFDLKKSKIKKKQKIHHGFNPLKVVTKPMAYLTSGIASWYGLGDGFQGARTASGVRFNTYSPMCAMRFLRFGTWVHIKNLNNGLVSTCQIMDRGPFARGRVIDLSYTVKNAIGMKGGTAPVVIW